MTQPAPDPTKAFVEIHAPRKSAPLQGTESAALAITRVHYTHDAMIDLIIANPGISQNAIAKHFGYTVPWVSRIFNSDAFQARLADRKSDLVDPLLLMSIDDRLSVITKRSLEIVHEKLEATQNADLAMRAAEMSLKALGYGARQANVSVQQNFVVAMPQKVENAHDWAAKHRAKGAGTTVEEAIEVQSPDLAKLVQGPTE